MQRRFVTEAVMMAIYGQILVPSRPVEYVIPYSSVMELYDLVASDQPIMHHADEDVHIKASIHQLIQFFEEPLNKKKLERALAAPWRKSPTLLASDRVSITVVYALENAEYGEAFDPIETDLILLSIREQCPLLTDQFELLDKLIQTGVPIEAFDIDDFEYALEDDVPPLV